MSIDPKARAILSAVRRGWKRHHQLLTFHWTAIGCLELHRYLMGLISGTRKSSMSAGRLASVGWETGEREMETAPSLHCSPRMTSKARPSSEGNWPSVASPQGI